MTKKFRIHWIGGDTEEISGESVATAFTAAGYGNGALKAMDWIETVSENDFQEFLGYVRKEIGDYCNDHYWLAIYSSLKGKGHNPIQIVMENLSMYATNAIATDYSSQHG